MQTKLKNISRLIVFLSFIPLLSGCGYQYGQGALSSEYRTISIPYIEEDWDGQLTAELIKQISASGAFEYRLEGGELILKVVILDFDDENIGFRYNRNKRGAISKEKSIVPDETRITADVEVSVVDAVSSKVLLEPVRITSSLDFDHDYYSSIDGVNIFSLGQFSDFNEALDAVHKPLNAVIAQKIVDYLTDSW